MSESSALSGKATEMSFAQNSGIEKKTKALLAFGSVRPYKELPKLIDAVVDARKKGAAGVCLLIAGRGAVERIRGRHP